MNFEIQPTPIESSSIEITASLKTNNIKKKNIAQPKLAQKRRSAISNNKKIAAANTISEKIKSGAINILDDIKQNPWKAPLLPIVFPLAILTLPFGAGCTPQKTTGAPTPYDDKDKYTDVRYPAGTPFIPKPKTPVTPAPTNSAAPSIKVSPSPAVSSTPQATESVSPGPTITPSASPSKTPEPVTSPTPQITPSPIVTPNPSPSQTPQVTSSPSAAPSPSPSAPAQATPSPTPAPTIDPIEANKDSARSALLNIKKLLTNPNNRENLVNARSQSLILLSRNYDAESKKRALLLFLESLLMENIAYKASLEKASSIAMDWLNKSGSGSLVSMAITDDNNTTITYNNIAALNATQDPDSYGEAKIIKIKNDVENSRYESAKPESLAILAGNYGPFIKKQALVSYCKSLPKDEARVIVKAWFDLSESLKATKPNEPVDVTFNNVKYTGIEPFYLKDKFLYFPSM